MIRLPVALPRSPHRRVSPDGAWPLQLTPRRQPVRAKVTMREWLERNARNG